MRKWSIVSVVIFFVLEYWWLNRLIDRVNVRLEDGKWTNTILYQVMIEPRGMVSLLFILLGSLFVVGFVIHYLFYTPKSWQATMAHVGIGWTVPLLLVLLALVIPNVYVQVGLLVLQFTFIPLIPYVGQTVPFWKIVTNWLVQLAVIGVILYGGRGMVEDVIRVEKTELFSRLESYEASGDLERIERLMEQVDLEQVERILDKVDIEQLIRILEVVDLDRIEQLLDLFG